MGSIKKEWHRVSAGILFCLLLSGCTSTAGAIKTESVSDTTGAPKRVELGRVVSQPDELIANDLVSALSQMLVRTKGSPGVIKVKEPQTQFGIAVRKSLIGLGYTVEDVNRNDGKNVVLTTVIPATDQNIQTHIIAMDQIALKRTYSVVKNRVTPRSSLFVRGADTNSIQLDDRIFLVQ